MNRVLVIIPTYNELENIRSIIQQLHEVVPDAAVLVVDDGSPDGTGILADAIASRDSRIAVLHRPGKEGLGAAYRAGFARGLDEGYDFLVEMDADGSHDPQHLPHLLAALDTADVALGSRWIPEGSVTGWSRHRQLLSQAGSAYARLALGLHQRDVTGGYRAYRADALRSIHPETMRSQGYCFQIEMLWTAAAMELDIVEVPITFAERIYGSSKMSTRIIVEAMLRVTGWGVRALPGRLNRTRENVQPMAHV